MIGRIGRVTAYSAVGGAIAYTEITPVARVPVAQPMAARVLYKSN